MYNHNNLIFNTMSNSSKTNVPVQFPTMLEYFWDLDGLSNRSKEMQPTVNVRDLPKKYELKIAAPGFKKKDFSIGIEHGQMTINAQSNSAEDKDGEIFSRREFSCSSIYGTFTLPEDINEDKISAEYKRGILTIKLKKPGNGSVLKQQVKIK